MYGDGSEGDRVAWIEVGMGRGEWLGEKGVWKGRGGEG